MKRAAKVELFLSDARGVYIPRDFAQCVERETVSGIDLADLDYLAEGPDQKDYWDAWSDVCDHCVLTDPKDGTVYTLYQDGDLFLIEQGAEFDESGDLGFETGWYIDDGSPDQGELDV